MGNETAEDQYFWIPRTALATYSAFTALLFALGQQYGLPLWLLVSALPAGALMLFLVGRSVRASQKSRSWVGTESAPESISKRPGLGNLLFIMLLGPAPFLLSGALQYWLAEIGAGAMWVVTVSAMTVFVFIFAGYCLIEALFNRRISKAAAAS